MRRARSNRGSVDDYQGSAGATSRQFLGRRISDNHTAVTLVDMPLLCEQSSEILENIVDEMDWREDLLSLALTCTLLCDTIIPSHLSYRRVVVSIFFRPFFEHIAARPDLASRVRELTVVNTLSNFEIPRVHAFRREYPESCLLFASGYDDKLNIAWKADESGSPRPLDFLAKVNDTLASSLPRLRLLKFHLGGHEPFSPRLPPHSVRDISFEPILAVHHPYLDGFALQSKWPTLEDLSGHAFPTLTSHVSY